jgi:hypothetical protein
MSKRVSGAPWALSGRQLAHNGGQWRCTVVATGAQKNRAATAIAVKTFGAGDGNRTRVLSLGS